MKKRAITIGAVYILIAIIIILGFNGMWEKPYPEYILYEGETRFDEKRAYSDLVELINSFPNRHFGSENVKKAGYFVKQRFKEMGLTTETHDFEAMVLKNMISPPEKPDKKMFTDMAKVKGTNIIGISPGRVKDAILIGAHRDTIFTVQGAEDNGTGTVSMLELARVLTKGGHKYTYIFASFDGEELGLYGSQYFAAHSSYPVKFAVSLDMVGYKNANNIYFYENISGKGASPVWVKALSRQILALDSRKDYSSAVSKNNKSILSTYMIKRTRGNVSTDTGPFVDRSIASLGIKAGDDSQESSQRYGRIHSNQDTIDQVSPETLKLTGTFTERFVRSLELNSILEGTYSRNYIPLPDGYIPGYIINITIALIFLLLAVPPILLYSDVKNSGMDMKKTFKREGKIILISGAISLITTLVLYMLVKNLGITSNTKIIFTIVWYLLNIPVSIIMILYRKKQLKNDDMTIRQANAAQKFILNAFMAAWALAGSIIINPFAAFSVSAVFVLVFTRAGFSKKSYRIIWRILFILFYVPFGYGAFNNMVSYILNGSGFREFFMPFWISILWIAGCIYITARPNVVPGT